MTDGVDIDEGVVDAAIAALRTRATTWAGHGTGLRIYGVGSEIADRTTAAVEAWKTEFSVASTGVTELADGLQADLDAFAALDSGMSTSDEDSTP